MLSNNQILLQCLGCGTRLAEAIKGQFTPEERAQMNDFDLDLRTAGMKQDAEWRRRKRAEADAEMQRIKEAKCAEFWARYEAHIKSDTWKEKRKLVMDRSRSICEGCGTKMARHVHHRTYEHLGDEFLFELVALCVPCHERIHGREIG